MSNRLSETLNTKEDEMLITDIQLAAMHELIDTKEIVEKLSGEVTKKEDLKNFLKANKKITVYKFGTVINLKTDTQEKLHNEIKNSADSELQIFKNILDTKISVIYKYTDDQRESWNRKIEELIAGDSNKLTDGLKELLEKTFHIWAGNA